MNPQVQAELEAVRRVAEAPRSKSCSYELTPWHPHEALQFRTISVPRKRKRVVFGVCRCDECGKQSINGGTFHNIGSGEEFRSALEQAYLEGHPRARTNVLDFGRADVKHWVPSGWTCGPWNV